jgi:type IV secretory pathway TrbD component
MQRLEGFELSIHQSAIKQQLVIGIPRQLALVLYTLIAALSFPLGTWYAIPPGLFLHLVFVAAAKKDPFFWDVFRRAFLYRHFYRG